MNKMHILSEIKRTAAANGGVPLGRGRFLRETGIKTSDWIGKFWARWSDALREAGFAPNEKQAAYEENMLIEKYIGLTRELGHFPVDSELRLKAKHDVTFPSHTTFINRLGGSKQSLVATILNYCKSRMGYDDIIAMCTVISVRALDEVAQRESEPDELVGFVYLMKSGRYYKIGRTNATGRRQYELAIQMPEKLNAVHIMRTDDRAGIEDYWHRRFANKRKNGEWFDLSAADVRAFKRRKFM